MTQREKDEKEVEGQIKKQILDLYEWVMELKTKSPKPDNVGIKLYNTLPLDFYFRMDNRLYIGPYEYGKSSQQTITYEFKKNAQGFEYYSKYFETLWNDDNFCSETFESEA